MSNFYYYNNPYNFMQPISPPIYNNNSNPVTSTPLQQPSSSNSQTEEKQESKKRDRWTSAQTHKLVTMWKENIRAIESGKSRVIYAQIKVEVDKLGAAKTNKQITEKLRNMKDAYKKAKENNQKSGAAPAFPPFYHDFDEVLSDRDVVNLPEVRQIGCDRPASSCGSTSEESIDVPPSLPQRPDLTSELVKIFSG